MQTYKLIAVIVILALSIVDLSLTYYYVHKYKQWQPNKPYKLIELNPLLVFLWGKVGLLIGTFVGAVVILTLNYIVITQAHWIFIIILLALLIFALYNHVHNISLLDKLIEKYPSGYLPEETFGKVEGSN